MKIILFLTGTTSTGRSALSVNKVPHTHYRLCFTPDIRKTSPNVVHTEPIRIFDTLACLNQQDDYHTYVQLIFMLTFFDASSYYTQ